MSTCLTSLQSCNTFVQSQQREQSQSSHTWEKWRPSKFYLGGGVGGWEEEVGRIKGNLTTMNSINWNIQDNDYLQHFKNGCKHWAFAVMRRLLNTKVITSATHLKPSSPLFRGMGKEHGSLRRAGNWNE